MYYNPGDFIIDNETKGIFRIVSVKLNENGTYEYMIAPVEIKMNFAKIVESDFIVHAGKL